MKQECCGGVGSALGRVMIATIFLMSAVGNKIPKFGAVTEYMAAEGIPLAPIMLAGAVAFLILGSVSVMLGFWTRAGAALLLIFLVLATYFFHDFWTFEGAEKQMQLIQFMKNLSLMGAMVFLMAYGGGGMSLDNKLKGCCGEVGGPA